MKKRRADGYSGRKSGFMNGLLSMAAAACLLLSAVCRYVLPGVRFSAVLFLCGTAACVVLLLLNLWAAHSKTGRICRLMSICALAVCFLAFLIVEGMILWTGERPMSDEEPAAVIVLGAGVNGTIPSLTLRTRLDAAAGYLQLYPDVPVVLSGGQGPGEDITEAQAMFTALINRGIAPERLYLEEKSTSTTENLTFSMDVLKVAGVDTADVIAIVTNDFHLFRAQQIAREAGLKVIGVPAELPWWWLNANYYVREFFALGKLWLIG